MRNWDSNSRIENKLFDGIFMALFVILPAVALFVASHCFIYPHWPSYVSCLLTAEQLTSCLGLLIYSWWFAIAQGVWALVGVMLMFLLLNMWYMWLLLREFDCKDTKTVQGI